MPLDDQQLMRLVMQGRTECFAELVCRYRAALERVALSKLHDRADAEDVVQETFLAVLRFKHTFDVERSFRGWLWTILLNHCRQMSERNQRQHAVEGEPIARLSAAHEPCSHESGLSNLLIAERTEHLHLLLQRLPEAQADALRLRFFGDLKFDEIADVMRCSLNAAKDRVRRGLLKLAELARPLAFDDRPEVSVNRQSGEDS